ncbi:hypothetical protein BH09MYX1_BH09MYX1_05740 [soil metagenome]
MTYELGAGRTWHAIAGKVTSFGTLPTPNTEWNAVTLLDGSVLGVGGGACGGAAVPRPEFPPR